MGSDRERKIEAVAEAWASIDGRLGKFHACKADPVLDGSEGYFSGYCAEAADLLKRLEARGYTIAKAAPETVFAAQHISGEG